MGSTVFLELLRHRLPYSWEHFHLTGLLCGGPVVRNMPAFKDIWSECLGGLRSYRMAVHDGDVRQSSGVLAPAGQQIRRQAQADFTTIFQS